MFIVLSQPKDWWLKHKHTGLWPSKLEYYVYPVIQLMDQLLSGMVYVPHCAVPAAN